MTVTCHMRAGPPGRSHQQDPKTENNTTQERVASFCQVVFVCTHKLPTPHLLALLLPMPGATARHLPLTTSRSPAYTSLCASCCQLSTAQRTCSCLHPCWTEPLPPAAWVPPSASTGPATPPAGQHSTSQHGTACQSHSQHSTNLHARSLKGSVLTVWLKTSRTRKLPGLSVFVGVLLPPRPTGHIPTNPWFPRSCVGCALHSSLL